MNKKDSYLSKIGSSILEKYQTILSFCIFLVVGALLTLASASFLEYQIENKTISFERLAHKEEVANTWFTLLNLELVNRTTTRIEGENMINTFIQEGENKIWFELSPERQEEVLGWSRFTPLYNMTTEGVQTTELLLNDLVRNFEEFFDEFDIASLIDSHNELDEKFVKMINDANAEEDKDIPVDNLVELLYELKKDQDELGSQLLNALSKIHRKISEEKRFISAEIKQLNYLTSRIVFFSFSIQILIYFLFQYFEVFSKRRLLR